MTKTKKRNVKGVLLTLTTIVLFLLMLSEIIAYVELNIAYENITSSSSSAIGPQLLLSSVNSGAKSFLQTSLSSSIHSLDVYNVNSSLRSYHFINNTAYALESAMYNGTIYGANVISYMNGATLKNFISSIKSQALSQGANLSVSNATITVYQAQPFYVNATLTALININSSLGTINYPIIVRANASLNGTEDVSGATTLSQRQMRTTSVYPSAVLIGNTLANSGSESPYLFAYGIALNITGTPTCATIPAQYKNNNYILVTKNAQDITQNICGMGGLVANTINSTTPLKPYLSFSAAALLSINNGTSILLDGSGLSVLDLSELQESMQNNNVYYYPSELSPSYLDNMQNSGPTSSGSGIFSFSLLDDVVPYFNGAGNVIVRTGLTTSYLTISFWVYGSSTPQMTGSNGYILLNGSSNQNVNVYLNGGGGLGALPGSGDVELSIDGTNKYHGYGINGNSWNFIAIVLANGKATFYANQEPGYTTNIIGGAYTFAPFTLGQGSVSGLSQFSGYLANLQVYNTQLSPGQVSEIYSKGIDGPPITNSSLWEWLPLIGNSNGQLNYASDFSGNGNNGIATGLSYNAIPGYTADPIFQNTQNRFNTSVVKGALNCANMNQCGNTSLSHLYLSSLPLYVSNGIVENEAATLGISNGILPDGVTFDGRSSYAKTLSGYPSNTYAISAWIYPTKSSSNTEWAISSSPFGNIGIGFTTTPSLIGECDGTSASASGQLSYNTWYFATLVCGGSSVSLYLNGSQVGSAGGVSGNTITNLIFGNYSAGNGMGGAVSDVQLYYGSSLPSASNAVQLYLNNSVIGASPIGYWPLISAYNGISNVTSEIIGNNNARFYNANGICSVANTVYGTCGVYYSQT